MSDDDNNNSPPPPPPPPLFEIKLHHYIKFQPEAEEFIVDVEVKIFLQRSSSPLEISISTTVDDFVWEDEDCYERVELYEFCVNDAGIDEDEAQFLVNDMVLYISKMTQLIPDVFTGVCKLIAEIRENPVGD